MSALEDAGQPLSPQASECVFWGTLFHDVGLTQNLDEHTHGDTSAEIFQEYVSAHNVKFAGSVDEIIKAIRFHDDKDYKNALYQQKSPVDPVAIVCASDDLDAYGAIGVFRYAEIYLMRGIGLEELAERVLKNVAQRFENFTKLYEPFDELYNSQKARYMITKNFYEALHEHNESAFEIIKFFKKSSIEIESIVDIPELIEISDEFSVKYIEQLEKELRMVQ